MRTPPALPPSPATIRDLAVFVHHLEAWHGWLDDPPDRCCFRMGEEVGELFRAVRDAERLGADAARPAVADEIVDVLNYLLAIANRFDIDIETAFRAKNERNVHRSWAN